MNRNEIIGVVDAYKRILLEEWNSIAVLASWDVTVLSHKAAAIAYGYESGVINGKNVENRKAQEAKVLEDDEAYQLSLQNQLSNRNNMKQLEIERKCVESRISLLRAWLYSQSEVR